MKFRTFRIAVVGGLLGAGGLVYWLRARPAATLPHAEVPLTLPALPQPQPEKFLAKPLSAPVNAAPTQAAPARAAPGDLALRAMDQEILDRLGVALRGDKAKDVLPGRAYKVNLFQEGGATLPSRVKIDLDRDDRWDEKWTIERPGGVLAIKRHVAPADDERYTDEYRLEAGRWRRK